MYLSIDGLVIVVDCKSGVWASTDAGAKPSLWCGQFGGYPVKGLGWVNSSRTAFTGSFTTTAAFGTGHVLHNILCGTDNLCVEWALKQYGPYYLGDISVSVESLSVSQLSQCSP